MGNKRFWQAVEAFQVGLEKATTAEEVALCHQQLTLALENLRQAEIAELRARVICGTCLRVYSDAEWEALVPSPAGQWRKDEHDLQEVRICAVCEGPLYVTVESYGGHPPKGSRRTETLKADRRRSWCGGCGHEIELGVRYVEYMPRSSGRSRPVPRNLCLQCDALTKFLDPGCLPPPPRAQEEEARHPIECRCEGCEVEREKLRRHFEGEGASK